MDCGRYVHGHFKRRLNGSPPRSPQPPLGRPLSPVMVVGLPTHPLLKGRMVVPLSVIEEGSQFDSSRRDAAGGPVTSCKARE